MEPRNGQIADYFRSRRSICPPFAARLGTSEAAPQPWTLAELFEAMQKAAKGDDDALRLLDSFQQLMIQNGGNFPKLADASRAAWPGDRAAKQKGHRTFVRLCRNTIPHLPGADE